MNLICDINVFYRLSDGRLSTSELPNHPIVLSGVNIQELSSSFNVFKIPDTFMGAILYADRISFSKIFMSPSSYILNRNNIFCDDDTRQIEIDWKNLVYYANKDIRLSPSIENKIKFRELINKYDASRAEFVDHINSNLLSFRQNLKSIKLKANTLRRIDQIETVKEMLCSLLSGHFGEYINKNRINWNECELWLYAWHSYLIELGAIPGSVAKINDIDDLMNLVYVNCVNNDKYLTLDGKFLNKIVANPVCKQYLYKEAE